MYDAKREIELWKKQQLDGSYWDDYISECGDAALALYNAFRDQGHSGMSAEITFSIFKRLANHETLTPITEDNADWGEKVYKTVQSNAYQSGRYSGLFKTDYYELGAVEYSDVNRIVCFTESDKSSFTNGFVRSIIDEMVPITLPYMPGNVIHTCCEEFLVDEKNGDFDTIGILYFIKPDGGSKDVKRFFTDPRNESLIPIGPPHKVIDGWVEIDYEEYLYLKDLSDFRRKMKNEKRR